MPHHRMHRDRRVERRLRRLDSHIPQARQYRVRVLRNSLKKLRNTVLRKRCQLGHHTLTLTDEQDLPRRRRAIVVTDSCQDRINARQHRRHTTCRMKNTRWENAPHWPREIQHVVTRRRTNHYRRHRRTHRRSRRPVLRNDRLNTSTNMNDRMHGNATSTHTGTSSGRGT
jgi:hypothetical protein